MAANSVTLSAVGPSAAIPIANHSNQPSLVNVPANPWSPMLATIVCVLSPGASLVYNIEFSNDGINFLPDANASNLASGIIYATGAFTNYWRLNVLSWSSGSVSAAYGAP